MIPYLKAESPHFLGIHSNLNLMKENKSANFGPRLHSRDSRLYTSKPLKNKLKANKHYGVKNVSLSLNPAFESTSSISTHTTALRNGSLGSNKASSRRYEMAHES